nr:hypothetical protein [Rhodococcus sp. (in: high G+C Gram-positive bacteria)]
MTEPNSTLDAKAHEMKIEGRTFFEIAAELGFSDWEEARDAVRRHWAANPLPGAAEVRERNIKILDEMRRGLENHPNGDSPARQRLIAKIEKDLDAL